MYAELPAWIVMIVILLVSIAFFVYSLKLIIKDIKQERFDEYTNKKKPYLNFKRMEDDF